MNYLNLKMIETVPVEWVIALGAIVLIAAIVCFARYLQARDDRARLSNSLQDLRVFIAQAESWVETKPASQEAQDNLRRAKLLLKDVEGGLKGGRQPWAILESTVSNVGIGLAIAARYKAQADKQL